MEKKKLYEEIQRDLSGEQQCAGQPQWFVLTWAIIGDRTMGCRLSQRSDKGNKCWSRTETQVVSLSNGWLKPHQLFIALPKVCVLAPTSIVYFVALEACRRL